jgi:hypothetical protein
VGVLVPVANTRTPAKNAAARTSTSEVTTISFRSARDMATGPLWSAEVGEQAPDSGRAGTGQVGLANVQA